jgi:hypothetical protein
MRGEGMNTQRKFDAAMVVAGAGAAGGFIAKTADMKAVAITAVCVALVGLAVAAWQLVRMALGAR